MYLKVHTLALFKVLVSVVEFFLWFIWHIACTHYFLIFIVHNNYCLKVVARHCWWIYFTMKFPWKRSREFTFIHSCWMFTQVCLFIRSHCKLILLFYAADNTISQTDDNEDSSNHRVMEIFQERVMMTLRSVIKWSLW